MTHNTFTTKLKIALIIGGLTCIQAMPLTSLAEVQTGNTSVTAGDRAPG